MGVQHPGFLIKNTFAVRDTIVGKCDHTRIEFIFHRMLCSLRLVFLLNRKCPATVTLIVSVSLHPKSPTSLHLKITHL